MIEKRPTATDAKKIWLRVLYRNINKSIFYEYLETILPRLKALKFTYGGKIKKERYVNGKGKIPDKNYVYIKKHFPTLIKKFEKEIEGEAN